MGNLFKPSVIGTSMIGILPSLLTTLKITAFSMLLGLVLGFLLAMARIKKIPVLKSVAAVYISFMRGTPLLVQIFLSYYGIPMALNILNYKFGISFSVSAIPAIAFVFVAFSMNEAAYLAETIRSAILSVDIKDIEAAYSIGMTGAQTMRRVILPQAMMVAIPNLGNSLISLVKSTSLAYTIGVIDMTGKAKILSGNNLRFFEVYIGLALLYWIICILIEALVRRLERRFNILEREVAADDRDA